MEKDNKELLLNLINQLVDKITKCLQETNNGISYIDPIEGKEISAHYAQSHAASAFVLLGHFLGENSLMQKGRSMLIKLLSTHSDDIKLTAYHFDFNNFAIAIIRDYIDCEKTKVNIEKILLITEDSNHPTVNWLPMRSYVNLVRYDITKELRYKSLSEKIINEIKRAMHNDGFIDDLLPKGKSFNLQYNISTLAELLFIDKRKKLDIDLERCLQAVVSSIPMDNDINYMGRGCNQVFAWGPWIYILSQLKDGNLLSNALQYLGDRLPDMLKNDTMMLNDIPGNERYLWWDYHYASVYTAHLFLWLCLALTDCEKKYNIATTKPEQKDSGFSVYRNLNYFAATFTGRNKYLAEQGPSLVGLGSAKLGMICKASFAPYQGPFGLTHSYLLPTFLNYCGLIQAATNYDYSQNAILRHLNINNSKYIQLQPQFCAINVNVQENGVEITWENEKRVNCFFNIPVLKSCDIKKLTISLICDGKAIPLVRTGSIITQYGECYLLQTQLNNAKVWKLRVE